MTRKQITRGHLIAAYSANFVEYQVLEAGYLLERIVNDYGIDGHIWTFDERGGIENGEVKLQLKATDRLSMDREDSHLLIDVAMKDVDLWRKEPMPVLLVVYDARLRQAYWLHMQAYWREFGDEVKFAQRTWRVKIPKTNVFNAAVVERFRVDKNKIVNRFWTRKW